MSERGSVAIDRGVFTHDAFAAERYTKREAWIWMIAEAAWKPHVRRIGPRSIPLERGQFTASLRFLAERWQWTRSAVVRFLADLQRRDMIGTTTHAGITVVSLCNYDGYQPGQHRHAKRPTTSASHWRDKGESREKQSSPSRSSGEDGELRERRSAPKETRHLVSENWKPDNAQYAYAANHGCSPAEIDRQARRFRNHYRARGIQLADISAAWQNWIDPPASRQPQPAAPEQRPRTRNAHLNYLIELQADERQRHARSHDCENENT
jgi:hypothetical protein